MSRPTASLRRELNFPPRANWSDLAGQALTSLARGNLALASLGLLVYGLTRFAGLSTFPIYFFSDEAIQPLLAEQLLRNVAHIHVREILFR